MGWERIEESRHGQMGSEAKTGGAAHKSFTMAAREEATANVQRVLFELMEADGSLDRMVLEVTPFKRTPVAMGEKVSRPRMLQKLALEEVARWFHVAGVFFLEIFFLHRAGRKPSPEQMLQMTTAEKAVLSNTDDVFAFGGTCRHLKEWEVMQPLLADRAVVGLSWDANARIVVMARDLAVWVTKGVLTLERAGQLMQDFSLATQRGQDERVGAAIRREVRNNRRAAGEATEEPEEPVGIFGRIGGRIRRLVSPSSERPANRPRHNPP